MPTARPASKEARSAYHHGDLKRAVVDAALALVKEEQSWDFSLREVARRAGVSHNAPYNHFTDKRSLLAAVAVAGFEALRTRMQAVAEKACTPDEALAAIGMAYVQFGTENPAHYRLMFGPTLTTDAGGLPSEVAEAAEASKLVLEEAVLRGAEAGFLEASSADKPALDVAVLSAWSMVHGLTLLLVDGMATAAVQPSALDGIAERVTASLLHGLLKR